MAGCQDRTCDASGANVFFTAPLRYWVVGLVFLAAFLARLYRITDPPLVFFATRQYRSALIARGYYFETVNSVPAWRRRNATLAKNRQGILEPPIMEILACGAYHVAGGEYLWLPRLMASVFWLVGGVFLYLLAARTASADAAVVSVAFFLFLPYAILASRSFQPDPLMVMLFLGSLYAIVCYFEKPGWKTLSATTAACAAAVFVKPVCLTPIVGAFVGVAVSTQPFRTWFFRKYVWLWACGLLLPIILFYAYDVYAGGSLRSQAKGTFIPHLLINSEYWDGWLHRVRDAIGYLPVVVALFGLWLFPPGIPRGLVIGLWVGYFAFGVAFNYRISTHSYYHLFFLAVVALCFGPVDGLLFAGARQVCNRSFSRATVVCLFFMALATSTENVRRLDRQSVAKFIRTAVPSAMPSTIATGRFSSRHIMGNL